MPFSHFKMVFPSLIVCFLCNVINVENSLAVLYDSRYMLEEVRRCMFETNERENLPEMVEISEFLPFFDS